MNVGVKVAPVDLRPVSELLATLEDDEAAPFFTLLEDGSLSSAELIRDLGTERAMRFTDRLAYSKLAEAQADRLVATPLGAALAKRLNELVPSGTLAA